MQNLLRLIGGPLNFKRDDYPYRTDFYPFVFSLEPLTRESLAKYIAAEMPPPPPLIQDRDLREIILRAVPIPETNP